MYDNFPTSTTVSGIQSCRKSARVTQSQFVLSQLPYTNRFTEKTTSKKIFFRIGAAFYLYFYSQIALDKNYEKLPGL